MIRIVTWSRERKSLYLSQDEEIDPNISGILYTLLCTKYIVDTLMWRGEGSTLGYINSEYNLGTPSNKRLISLRITLLPLVCRLGSRGRVKNLYLFAVVFVLTFVDEKYPAMTIEAWCYDDVVKLHLRKVGTACHPVLLIWRGHSTYKVKMWALCSFDSLGNTKEGFVE